MMDTNSSRRSFLKGSAVVGVAHIVGSPAFAASVQPSVIVVGAGAFGGWSALQLVQRGVKDTMLDAWGPGNSRASSGGETRTIRATYGPAHLLYTKMVARALQLWQEYEQRWNVKLFFRSGALRMAGADDSYESAALPVLKDAGIRFEKLSVPDCAKRWPQINFDGVSWSVYEPDSGFLAARRGCEAVLNAFLKEGGKYRQAQASPGSIVSHRMQGISSSPGEILNATIMFSLLVHGLEKSSRSWRPRSPRLVKKFSFSALLLAMCASQKSNCPPGLTGASILFLVYPETTGAASRS